VFEQRGFEQRGSVSVPRNFGFRSFNSRAILVPNYRFDLGRPYYAFRPRFTLRVGLFVGYPIAFPTWYSPYVYGSYYGGPYYDGGYYDSYSYNSQPAVQYGGLSFDIDPTDAAVFVDGNYVGVVSDFSPYEAPLTLAGGRHHIDLRAQGCDPMSFDITIVSGQIIPYQGSMAYVR